MSRTLHPLRIYRVFHPTDFSESGDLAFAHALRVALACQCELSLMHVDPPTASPDFEHFPAVRDRLITWGELQPGATVHDLALLGLGVHKIQASAVDPVEAVREWLARESADLVVLATHPRQGWGRWLHRSVAEPIARSSGAATLFLPTGARGFVDGATGAVNLREMLVAVDSEPRPQMAVDLVLQLWKSLGARPARLTLFHVGSDDDLPPIALPDERALTVSRISRPGAPVTAIVEAAHELKADLVATSTAGRHGLWDALVGSTTEQILHELSAALLAVPAP